MVEASTKNRLIILGRNRLGGNWRWAPATAMRVKSKKSAEGHGRKPGETGSGKDLGNYTGFAHSRITAHLRASLAGYSTTTYDPISAFLSTRLFKWIPQVAKYWFHRKHAFRDYTASERGTGIYALDDRVKISIAGDWGTGTV